MSSRPDIVDMHKKISRPHRGSSLSEAVSLLRIRAAVAARVAGGVARAIADPDRMRELWHRLQDYDHYDRFHGAIGAPRKTFAGRTTVDAVFPLLVTSNSGLFLLEHKAWHCLLPVTCFGVARHHDMLYLGASAGLHSFVLSAEVAGKEGIDGLRNVKMLARYETRYHNERIHQIAYDPCDNVIHCANCRRNSLLAVDAGGRGIIDEKFLFADPSGSPFFTDQNHVNAVTVNGDALLFATRYAGSGGGLGFVANDTIRVYQYFAVGVHDVLIHNDAIMFTDSFRENSVLDDGVKNGAEQSPNPSGAIRFRGEEYLTRAIDTGSRRLVLRGLAMRGDAVAVGFSAWARREERMTIAGGGVMLFRDGKLIGLLDGPFGQVFDILPVNGARTDAPGPARTVDELDAMFRRDVGPLLFEAPLPRNVKIAPLR
jgi:hypothetical protein